MHIFALLLLTFAQQGSNGAFLYLIQDRSINIGDAFNINNNTGVIFVTGSLDHEVRPSYTFNVSLIMCLGM